MKKINEQNEEVYKLYQKYTEEFQSGFKASGYSFFSAWKLRKTIIDHMVSSIEGPRMDILDIGCNNGMTGRELCNFLNKNNIDTNIDGIDFIEDATVIAKEHFNYRQTYVADITDSQTVHSLLGENKYNMVFCCEVFLLLHPKDYENFFSTVHAHLNSGGFFLFVIPNIRSIYHLISKVTSPAKFKYYFKYDYDIKLIRSLFEQYNFDIVSICGADLLTKLKINLENSINPLRSLFSTEIAVLARKS